MMNHIEFAVAISIAAAILADALNSIHFAWSSALCYILSLLLFVGAFLVAADDARVAKEKEALKKVKAKK